MVLPTHSKGFGFLAPPQREMVVFRHRFPKKAPPQTRFHRSPAFEAVGDRLKGEISPQRRDFASKRPTASTAKHFVKGSAAIPPATHPIKGKTIASTAFHRSKKHTFSKRSRKTFSPKGVDIHPKTQSQTKQKKCRFFRSEWPVWDTFCVWAAESILVYRFAKGVTKNVRYEGCGNIAPLSVPGCSWVVLGHWFAFEGPLRRR